MHRDRSTHRRAAACLAASLVLLPALPALSADTEPTFREQSLELPGAPAALIPADLDGDGRRDLVVVVVYTEWDQIGIEEHTEMDQVAGLVEVLTIVPILMDRREVRAYLRQDDGSLAPAGEPLPLPLAVVSMEAGPPGLPVVALTDDGVAELVLADDGTLSLEPVIDEPPVLAGTGTFLAHLDLVADVTGDGVADLLVPAPDGIALFRGLDPALDPGPGVEATPFARVPYPEEPGSAEGLTLNVPLPTVVDADGDGLPDLLFRSPDRGLAGSSVALQSAPGRFTAPGEIPWPEPGDGDSDEIWIGPVDERPGAELVAADSLDDDDVGVRKSMEQAREPRFRLRVHALHPPHPEEAEQAEEAAPLTPDPDPERTFDVRGWVAQGNGPLVLPGGFQDLDGDGRSDLVTVTNDITLFKAVGILATRRLTLELGFLAWCQQPDGGFVRAPGEPLTSKLRINLNDLEIRQRSLFAGDFDGDGRRDFLQLGGSRGSRHLGVHLGRPSCAYSLRPDLEITLRDELRDMALAEALDLDGDGRSDLAVTHPRPVDEAGVSPPVRLDLYTSELPAGGRR